MKNLSLKQKKGLTLVEVLMYVVLLAIIAPIISVIMTHGFDSFKSNYNMIKQEDMVSTATQMLRNDIEYASKITLYSGNNKKMDLEFPVSSGKAKKTWLLDTADNTLKVGSTVIVKNLNVNSSKFENFAGRGTIILTLQPAKLNNVKNTNRNFMNPIITEFSVRYKTIIII
ncbi:MAG: hypothetical protein Q8942_18475 [Bacillota bacterium]|nr:hypothetical protein [Bacillota bacterium]